MSEAIIRQAIEAAGGVQALSRALGLKHTSIIGWRNRGQIPAERVPAVARASGIPASRLRPDVFGDQPAPAEAA